MPALASITIKDGAATPVDHVFAPVNSEGSLAEFANRSATIPAGFERLSVDVRKPSSDKGAYRVVVSLNRPTVGTVVSGQDEVVRISNNGMTLNFSQSSTLQERKDTLALLGNLCKDASFIAAVSNLEPFY